MASLCASSSSPSPSPSPVSFITGVSLLYVVIYQARLVSSAILISLRNQHHVQKRKPTFLANQSSCNLFMGSWVRDDSYPLYEASNCPLIDPQFNCQMYGRPDSGYERYRWEPTNCRLPRFNGQEFLLEMRGKSVMFVGDSLGRNQWESLICMLYTEVPHSQIQFMVGEPLSTLKFLDYGVSISYYKAPYLVDLDNVEGKRVLRLDDISSNGNAWKGVDVLSFDSGHWWYHMGSLQGWDYMEAGGAFYQDMDRLVAFERGMRTWANWVDTNVDRTATRVFFQAVSPTHYNPIDWGSTSSNCYGEKAPISGSSYSGAYPDQMRIVHNVLNEMTNRPYLLDITTLSELRKDGHPSIYSGDLNPQQRANPQQSADCSHWCLPGLPDTWNQLFYTALFF